MKKVAGEEGAIRVVVTGRVQGVGYREFVVGAARRLGLMGWVRNVADGSVLVHAEGSRQALVELVELLAKGPSMAQVGAVDPKEVKVEGHEQFAIRGVSAGAFVVVESTVGRPHFELRLEVGGGTVAWVLPNEPSMDPAVKRLAIESGDTAVGEGATTVWDHGTYEQGGRVAWPEALVRGHAVFVLNGEKLRGGFALQRTRGGDSPQWLLIKRRE